MTHIQGMDRCFRDRFQHGRNLRRPFLRACVAIVTLYGAWTIMMDFSKLSRTEDKRERHADTIDNYLQVSLSNVEGNGKEIEQQTTTTTSTTTTTASTSTWTTTQTPNATFISLHKLAEFWSDAPVCQLLRAGDNFTAEESANDTNVTAIEWQEYLSDSCTTIRSRGYVLDGSLLSEEERSFPIAFSILMYTSLWQFERLLRAIYRPQNVYCIHVDSKTNETLFAAVSHLASCFDNVIVASERYAIRWGTISIIDAELSCMRELRDRSSSWLYFINLTGQEYPLQSMWQIVRALKSMNNLNSIDSGCPPHPSFEHRIVNMRHFAGKFSIVPCVGSTHIIVVRGFVEHLLENPLAKMLHSALINDQVPDESFFGTLDHNAHLGLPGARDFRNPPPMDFNPSWNRLKNWVNMYPCHGKYVRQLCIWGVADLPFLTNSSRRELFTNKLHWDYQHFALDCLESWYWNKTISELVEHWFHAAELSV